MRSPLRHASVRFPVDPRGVPAGKAARRLGITEAEFRAIEPRLFGRGFPRPDPDTGCFDLKAVDAWMDQQSSLTAPGDGRHAPRDLRNDLDAWTPEPSRSRRPRAAGQG